MFEKAEELNPDYAENEHKKGHKNQNISGFWQNSLNCMKDLRCKGDAIEI